MDKQHNSIVPRKGCVDVWNAFMVDGADFTLGSDMPICKSTASSIPKDLRSFTEAKKIHKSQIMDDPDYYEDAFIHFYYDDQKFDGPYEGVWSKPEIVLEIARHFSGVISPDFSTYADFPDPIKRGNIYRMRAFDSWLAEKGIPVIPNIRWGTEETWEYCFDGIPVNSMVAIGTVASGIHKLENRHSFEKGLIKMVELLYPHTIITYGSANYSFFNELANKGLKIVSFPSSTNKAYLLRKGGKKDE